MLKYFAYGSNMSSKRLVARVPSAKALGVYTLSNYRLAFHMSSQDGSSKCNAHYTGNDQDQIIGVLYDIESQHKSALDTVEGLGVSYDIKYVTIKNQTNQNLQAFTYVSLPSRLQPQLSPYTWYKNHVLIGALENSLPQDYIDQFISSIAAKQDPKSARHEREIAIHDGYLSCID